MSGLIASLQNSSNALRVHSKGLEVAGKNLANINNRGYSKQRVEIGDRGSVDTGIATETMGVEAMGLRQNRDSLLDKSVMREITSTSSLEATKKVLESAETALGQFLDRTKDSTSIQNASGASGGGISDALTDFFNSWESFSVKPNDTGEKQLLLAKAQILVDKINSTDTRLGQVQTDADAQVQTDVGVVNGLLAEIAKTNEYIAKAELVRPFSAVDLRDQRQAKLEELSQYLNVQFEPIVPDGLGQINVKCGGVDLINGKNVLGSYEYNASSRTLQFNATDDSKDSTYSNDNLPEGKIGAQILAASSNVQASRDAITLLATNLTSSVNAIYQQVDTVNKPQFFLTPASSSKIALNPAITANDLKGSAKAGSNDVALKIAGLGTDAIAGLGTNVTFVGHFNKTVTVIAQELNTTNVRLEDQKLSEEMAVSHRDAFSGVSQDEEMTDLMKFQRSFQASARHVNIIDTLLDQVVNRLGVG
ncbi:MAG: flagellar hook-associated protein FlgK [bacterium]